MVRKYLLFSATAIFLLFAYWQFNDLEQYNTSLWYGWVVPYAVTALLSLGAAFRPLPRAVYLVLAIFATIGALIRASAINWDASVLYNETNPAGNEAGGLLVVGLWLFYLALTSMRSFNSCAQ